MLFDRIHMENEHIRVWNEIGPRLAQYFKYKQGEKILKGSNSQLIKKIYDDPKFKAIIDESNYPGNPIPGGNVRLTLYVHPTWNNLVCVIKHCFSGGSYEDKDNPYYCVYVEHNLYIGELDQDVLASLTPFEPKTLVDFEKQKEYIIQHNGLIGLASLIRSQINPCLSSYLNSR